MVSGWSNTYLRGIEAPRPAVTKHNPKPTVSLGVTYAVVNTYECDDGRIAPTRCAIIDAGLDGRCRLRRTRRTPPAAARSARNALAAGLRPVSTADPGAFPRSRTTPPAGIRLCGDASPPKSIPGLRPCPPRLYRVCSSLQLSLSRFLSGMMRLSHHNTVTGGTTHGRCTVHRAAVPSDGVLGFHERDA